MQGSEHAHEKRAPTNWETPNTSSVPHDDNHCHDHSQGEGWAWLSKLCGLSLVIFCAYKEPKKLAIFAAVGFTAEVIQEHVLSYKRQKTDSCGGGCSDIGKLIMGRPLKPFEAILGATYLFYLHLEHELKPHLPFVGYFAGTGIYHTSRDLWTWAWSRKNSSREM
jgi:hypothetical protein